MPQELMSLCSDLGIERLRINTRGQLSGCCPFHNESRPSWGISGTKDFHPFNCLGCGVTGTLMTLVMRLENKTFKDARRFIRGYGDYETFDETDISISRLLSVEVDKKTWGNEVPDYMFLPYQQHTRKRFPSRYWKRRGLWEILEWIRKNDVNFYPGYDPDEQRVLLPWYSMDHKLRGVEGRYIGNDPYVKNHARFTAYFGLQRGRSVYSPCSRFMRLTKKKKLAIVVEGATDALSVARALWSSNCYCVFAFASATFSQYQVRQVLRLGLPVLPLFDNDRGGREARERFSAMADSEVSVRNNYKYPKNVKDPAQMSNAQIGKIVSCATYTPLI